MSSHPEMKRWIALACLVLAPALQCAQAAIPTEERDALIALYTSTNGDAWVNNFNWCAGACPSSGEPVFNDPGTECTWAGIGCDGTGTHVTSIGLDHNNMVGSLPATLSALTALSILDVHQNSIDGPMPPLSGLTSLVTVRVFGNALSGPLPALEGLANLETFLAYSNQFSGEIPSLDGLASLQEFAAEDNRLTGSIPDLSSLVSLQAFGVENNQLTGPIPDLSSLVSLLSFRVGGNRLSGSLPAFPQNDVTGPPTSSLCPNAIDTTPGPNDAGWDTQTGYTPWWATPYADNLCDDIFTDAFDAATARRATD